MIDLDRFESVIKLHKANNPISSKELETKLQCHGVEIRAAVHELREKGIPVCNSLITNGEVKKIYFVAEDRSEAEATIADLASREFAIRKARIGMENCFKLGNQITMEL